MDYINLKFFKDELDFHLSVFSIIDSKIDVFRKYNGFVMNKSFYNNFLAEFSNNKFSTKINGSHLCFVANDDRKFSLYLQSFNDIDKCFIFNAAKTYNYYCGEKKYELEYIYGKLDE